MVAASASRTWSPSQKPGVMETGPSCAVVPTGTSASTSGSTRVAGAGPSGPRANSVGAVGAGSMASAAHTPERGMPAKIASIASGARAIASEARRRASLGRPSNAAASDATTRATGSGAGPWSTSAAAAAAPAPTRSPVRQRTSARSTSPAVSSATSPLNVSSSTRASARSPIRRWAWARTCSTDRVGAGPLRALVALMTAIEDGAQDRAGGAPARPPRGAARRHRRAGSRDAGSPRHPPPRPRQGLLRA